MESAFVDDFIVYWPPILRFSPVFCPLLIQELFESPAGAEFLIPLIDPSVKTGPSRSSCGAAPVRALPRR
jgi:hypothetical protein